LQIKEKIEKRKSLPQYEELLMAAAVKHEKVRRLCPSPCAPVFLLPACEWVYVTG
jgi:hypothetical protein